VIKYTAADLNRTYLNWSKCPVDNASERQELWFEYCDVRDRVEPGTSKKRYRRIEINRWPQLVPDLKEQEKKL
jgi:hypothetical protein